ncbi:acylphosphatase [Spirochaetota bacterium]
MSDKKDLPKKAVFVLVRGRVQGVGFRYEAKAFARALNLCGWVTNLPDGGVETYAEGEIYAVDRYIAWLQKGPPGAKVISIDVSERAYTNKYRQFTIE